ncbi:MAG: hypothetical protein HFJ36_01035 [Clostridia bacterium]|nr:hypothetical protein [Clostridia bacterium]
MISSRYEYETSPRKVEPDIRRKKQVNPNRQPRKKKLRVVEDLPRQEVKISKAQKKKQIKLTFVVVGIFILLLTVSYRNSQINEQFTKVQSLKKDLASIKKENEQLEVSIENSLNINTVEKLAKEKLGMQKLTNKQTVYVALPKKDYVETSTEEVIVEEERNWLEQLIEKIFNK